LQSTANLLRGILQESLKNGGFSSSPQVDGERLRSAKKAVV
jgi:hypothetical protein